MQKIVPAQSVKFQDLTTPIIRSFFSSPRFEVELAKPADTNEECDDIGASDAAWLEVELAESTETDEESDDLNTGAAAGLEVEFPELAEADEDGDAMDADGTTESALGRKGWAERLNELTSGSLTTSESLLLGVESEVKSLLSIKDECSGQVDSDVFWSENFLMTGWELLCLASLGLEQSFFCFPVLKERDFQHLKKKIFHQQIGIR